MNANPLFNAVCSINAAKGSGFIKSVHRNGNRGIAFRRVWPGDKIDFVEFSIMRNAAGEWVDLFGYQVIISGDQSPN